MTYNNIKSHKTSRKTFLSSSKAILASKSILFKHLLTTLTIPSNIPPQRRERVRLKCYFKL